jgi:catalase
MPAAIPTFTAGISGRRLSPAITRSGNSACKSSRKRRPRKFSFDVLDATKLVPEEMVPVTPVGSHGAQPQSRQFLRRNRAGGLLHRALRSWHRLQQRPAYCRDAITPIWIRRSAAWEAPISTRFRSTRPLAAVHNNQRDGLHRQAIARGRVSYEPNSLGGGCPFQAGMKGFVSPSRKRLREQRTGRQGARQAGEVRGTL